MPDIQIHVEGIIAMLFERHSANPNLLTTCVLGVVNNCVPPHELKVKYKKNSTEVTLDPATVAQLKLEVENTTTTGIRLFNEQLINRITGQSAAGPADQQSASWILEFEGELYPRTPPIGADPAKFSSIFRVNNGEIFTEEISRNHLLTRPEHDPNDPFTLVGRVATRVGIRTNLDQQNSKARLSNTAGTIVEVVKGEALEITVALTCPTCSHTGQQTGHANNYYRALGKNLGFGEKKLFSSTKMPSLGPTPPISPEASCLVGRASTSNPNGQK